MKIEIRNDKAVVSGYVNAVGRDSRPITDVRGKFVEQIEPGAFRASLERSENVDLLLNHDKSMVYASTKDGSLKLTEDSIGLRAEAVLSDAEMIRKARSGEFRGWSFGMYVGDSAMEERAEGIPRRHVKSLNMFEVSLIDKSRIPCYVGTSVECRAEGEGVLAELRYSDEEPEIIEEERSEPEPVDYSAVDDVISELRYGAVDNVIAELRYNPYHDPSNGRFTSGGGGGGGGVLVVEKGQKGKGYYVVDKNNGEDFDDEEYKKWSDGKSGAKRQLDQTQIDRANAQGSNIYEAGSAIARTYDREYDEIGNLNISDAEKAAARDKIYEFSAAELQARQKYFDFYTAGPARKVTGSDKALEKSMNISSEHQSYMNSLRDKSAKNTSAQKEKAFSSAFNAEAQKANASGAREITVNGETWFRTTKTSSTWTKGTLKEYQAKKNFQKSQKDLPMVKRRGWSELSADEKAQYYRSFDPVDSVIEELRSSDPADYSAVDDVISELRYGAVDNVIAELRYNPYHDPSNGRFTSGGGGGGGVLFVGKGQKGKGVYVVDVDHDEEYKKWKAEKDGGGISAADKAVREATGGVIQKDEYTVVDAVATKKNSKASTTYDKTVLSADVDSSGNVVLKYAKGDYSGNYGDEVQNVHYKIKAGFVDDTPVNMDLSKAMSISGNNTYALRDVAKNAGMTWNSSVNAYIGKNHPLNMNTKFSPSELSSKSDGEIDAIYKSLYYKNAVAKSGFKGLSLADITAKANNLPKKTREEKIATINRINSKNS